MKLSDVMSGSGLAEYAVIALLIFFGVFVIVGLRLLLTRSRKFDHVAHLPLDDEPAIDHPRPRDDGREGLT